MKKLFLTSFAVLALLATASMVMAQPGQGGGQRGQGGAGGQGRPAGAANFQPGGGGGAGFQQQPGAGLGVLAIVDARTALGIDADAWQKLQDAAAAVRTANPGPARAGGGAGAPPAAPDPAAQAAARERQQKIAAETRAAIEGILSKDQVAKMDVMTFQRTGGLNPPAPTTAGPNAAAGGFGGGVGGGANPITVDSLRALELTDAQKTKVQEAIAKRTADTAALGPAAGGPGNTMTTEERTARREATQKITEEFFAAVKAALTDAQKAKAEELMKDVPTFLRPQRPGAGGVGASGAAGGGAGRGAGGAGAGAGRGAGGAGRGAGN